MKTNSLKALVLVGGLSFVSAAHAGAAGEFWEVCSKTACEFFTNPAAAAAKLGFKGPEAKAGEFLKGAVEAGTKGADGAVVTQPKRIVSPHGVCYEGKGSGVCVAAAGAEKSSPAMSKIQSALNGARGKDAAGKEFAPMIYKPIKNGESSAFTKNMQKVDVNGDNKPEAFFSDSGQLVPVLDDAGKNPMLTKFENCKGNATCENDLLGKVKKWAQCVANKKGVKIAPKLDEAVH